MSDNVRSFSRPTTPKTTQPTQQMVRVIDLNSPFFSWEGWISSVIAGEDETPSHVQIMCAHNGFQFPALTFAINQVVPVEPKSKG